MSFLADITKGKYDLQSEDRLSQVFSACFNHSKYLQQAFVDFFDIKPVKGLYAEPQISSDIVAARYDVELKDGQDTPFAIIENKIEASFGTNQLKKYEQDTVHRKSHKIALVKYLPLIRRAAWQYRRWSELHSYLVKRGRSIKPHSVDGFVFHEFTAFLKGLGMERVSSVSKKDMEALGKFLSVTSSLDRKKEISLLTAPVFEIGANYFSLVEEILEIARVDSALRKLIGKNFRFSPYLAKWWDDNESESNKAICMNWIGIEISLTRPRNGVSHIGTGAFFLSGPSNKVLIKAYSKSGNNGWKNKKVLKFKSPNITIEEHAAQTLSLWKTELGV